MFLFVDCFIAEGQEETRRTADKLDFVGENALPLEKIKVVKMKVGQIMETLIFVAVLERC